MKKIFLLTLFITMGSIAQDSYHKGHYVDIDNRKFDVQIKEYGFDDNITSLYYKENDSEQELSLPIEQVGLFTYKKGREIFVFLETNFNESIALEKKEINSKKLLLKLLSIGKNSSLYYRTINGNDEFYFTDLTKQAYILNENNFKEVIKTAFYLEHEDIFDTVEFNKIGLTIIFNKINALEEIKLKKNEDKNLNITTLEEIPIYPGCEQFATREGKMQCFNKKFMNHFSNNFNMPEIVKNQPNEVNIRVIASFVIDKDGHIKLTHVRAPFNEIEIELQKVFEKFPKITPGKKDGNPVSVRYAIPINLKTETQVNTDYYKRNNRYDTNRLHPYSTKN